MRIKSIKKISACRICHASNLYDFLILGDLPIPNGFVKKVDLNKEEERYPLVVTFCQDCNLVQLRYIVDPKIMFDNYLYIPSSSRTRIEHFKQMVQEVTETLNLDESSFAVDIGSNDGSLLNCFKNLGIPVLGVDPAKNLVKVAELNGIETVCGYYDSVLAKKILEKHCRASVIFATNVVAHIGNLYNFFKAVDILLDKKGIFVCQFPYILDLIEQNQFDTIYHEHLSYFGLKPLLKLAEKLPIEIYKVKRNSLDGGSVRVYWKKKNNYSFKIEQAEINKLLKLEKQKGLYNKKTYDEFAKRIKKLKLATRQKLKALKKVKKSIVGYGAAAKGNILLNYFGIGTKILDYVVDSTPYKQGLYMSGTHIPIFDESRIYQTHPDYILILAWNFKDEIMSKNKRFKDEGGKFIVPVPQFHIV